MRRLALTRTNYLKKICGVGVGGLFPTLKGCFRFSAKRIEYILEWTLDNPSVCMKFISSFQPEREFKVYKSCKCSQIICSIVVVAKEQDSDDEQIDKG